MELTDLFTSKHQSPAGVRNVPDAIKQAVEVALAEAKRGNNGAAIPMLKKIIREYPDLEIVRNALGWCLAGLDRFDEAETEFIEAIRITKVKREHGIAVPKSYPKEPERNLTKLYRSILSNKNPLPHSLPKRHLSQYIAAVKETLRRFLGSIRRKGVVAVVKKIPLFLNNSLHHEMRLHEKVFALRAEEFDRKNSVDTAGIIYQTDLTMNNRNQLHAVYYQGSDALFFNNALAVLKLAFNEYAFVDFGSGKGKALFLASAYPFKKIIGIEFSEVLDAIAQKNIRQGTNGTIMTYCMDVVDYTIPEEPLVCYFYDPFDACIMTKVIDNIRKAYTVGKRNIVIVYCSPRFHDLFDAEEWLTRVHSIGPIMIWSSP